MFAAEGLKARACARSQRELDIATGAHFHFDSKEAIYAEVLRDSLASLGGTVDEAVAKTRGPKQKLRAAAMAFFRYYAENPAIWISAYLFRGGMKPAGLGHARDEELNAALEAARYIRSQRRQRLSAHRGRRSTC